MLAMRPVHVDSYKQLYIKVHFLRINPRGVEAASTAGGPARHTTQLDAFTRKEKSNSFLKIYNP